MAYWQDAKWIQNNKYHNVKWEMDGEKFDSQKEARRWSELKLLERAGEIRNLRRQVSFELIPNQYIDGKLVERKCTYIADFVYEEDDKTVVEDTKSKATRTTTYILKKKMMLYFHNIQIKEV